MRPNIDLQSAGTQNLEIGDRRLGARKNHEIGVPRQGRLGFHLYHLDGGLYTQRIKVIEIRNARKNGNSDADFRVASARRWAIETERVFGRQEIRIGKKWNKAEGRPAGCPRNCVEPRVK